jgi:hypothetical protein
MKIYKIAFIALLAFVFAACQQAAEKQALSPTETLKALNEAAKKKDVETMKKLVSKGTLASLEKSAQVQETTVDELLTRDESVPFQELPETGDEKITGETATVAIRNNATGDWETMPFVREEGAWKIAFDKYTEELIKKLNEQMNQPPVNPPTTASDANQEANSQNNPAANNN